MKPTINNAESQPLVEGKEKENLLKVKRKKKIEKTSINDPGSDRGKKESVL